MAKTTAYFALRAGKIAGAGLFRKFCGTMINRVMGD
jgi:hypothetical protein